MNDAAMAVLRTVVLVEGVSDQLAVTALTGCDADLEHELIRTLGIALDPADMPQPLAWPIAAI